MELELFALPLAFLLEVTEEDEEVGRGEEFAESEEEVVLLLVMVCLCSVVCFENFSSKFANLSRKLQQLAREHVYMENYISKMEANSHKQSQRADFGN